MLSVILATHNGADTLCRTLDSFLAVIAPSGGWKLIIVDNASTDNTGEIITDYLDRLPIEYIAEPRLGKAFALNTGLEHIGPDSDFIVFVDDDVLVPDTFLCQWREVATKVPQISVFGGCIEPEFEVPPPDWASFVENWLTTLYSQTERGRPSGERPMDTADIYGPNMAIRSEIIAAGFRYDERFMVGSNHLMGDEPNFVQRILQKGYRTCFVTEPAVKHLVSAKQVTWKWIMRRFYRWGRSYTYLLYNRDRPVTPAIFGIPYFLYFLFFVKLIRAPVVFASCSRRKIIPYLRDLVFDWGCISQIRRMLHTDLSWSYGQSERDPDIIRRMQAEAAVIAGYIKENKLDTYVELGSYIGILAEQVKALCPDIRIICVEAVTETCCYLKRRLADARVYNYTIVPESYPGKISHFRVVQSQPLAASIYSEGMYRAPVGENIKIGQLFELLALPDLDKVYLRSDLEFIDHEIVTSLIVKDKLCPQIVHFKTRRTEDLSVAATSVEIQHSSHDEVMDGYKTVAYNWLNDGYDFYDYIYVKENSLSVPRLIGYAGSSKLDIAEDSALPSMAINCFSGYQQLGVGDTLCMLPTVYEFAKDHIVYFFDGSQEVRRLVANRNVRILDHPSRDNKALNATPKLLAYLASGWQRESLHMIEALKSHFGLGCDFEYPELNLTKINGLRPDILVFPYARGVADYRVWSKARWEALFPLFPNRIFTIMAGSEWHWDPRTMTTKFPNVKHLYGRPLPEVAWMIKHATVSLSIDNGMGHLTHMVGGNHVFLYPDSPPRWVANFRDNCTMIRGKPIDTTVEQVAKAMLPFLGDDIVLHSTAQQARMIFGDGHGRTMHPGFAPLDKEVLVGL